MGQTFCENCGTLLEAGDIFCTNCGHKNEPSNADQQTLPNTAGKPLGNNTLKIVLIAVVAIAAISVCVWVAKVLKPADNGSSSVANNQSVVDITSSTSSLPSSEQSKMPVPDITSSVLNEPIDFTRLKIDYDGFSTSGNTKSAFSSITKKALPLSDLIGTWKGKTYELGYYCDFKKDKEEKTEDGIKNITSASDVQWLMELADDISISIAASETQGKATVGLSTGTSYVWGLLEKGMPEQWDYSNGELSFQMKNGTGENVQLIKCRGITGKDGNNNSVIVILISLINHTPDTNVTVFEQKEIYLTK